MKHIRTGGRDRIYEGIVSKLPPHAVTKLAADLARRLFDFGNEGTRPSPAELGACARAVGALPVREREQHAEVIARVRDVLFTATILPPAVALFAALVRAKVSEAAAITEAKLSVTAHRGLVAVRARALRKDGDEELAGEHEQTLAALDQQLALLGERLGLAEAEVDELVATDPIAITIGEARALETALGIDILPRPLLDAAEAIRDAQNWWKGEIGPQLKRLGALVNDFEVARPPP